MEKRMSSEDERRLVRAVEKAATLALADESRDRSGLLANCLMEANVDSRFAHVASAAFNKRLTVLRFQRLPDERKEEPFDLSDASAVAACMGACACGSAPCATPCADSAPGEGVFVIELGEDPAPVIKVASARRPAVRYEERVPRHVMERHLESMMQKLGAAHSEMLGSFRSIEADMETRAGELSRLLKRASAFDRQVVCNVHGNSFCALMNAYDPDLGLRKTAAAVDDGSHLSRLAGQFVKKAAQRHALRTELSSFQQGLSEFVEEASKYSKELHRLNKRAYSDDADPLADLAEAGGTALDAAGSVAGAYVDTASQGIGTAVGLLDKALKPAGGVKGTAISPKLILDERYRNRLMAWSDMGADKLFAAYPAQKVFDVTNKLMNASAALELPENRELLRAHVGQALAQDGRLGTADMQALYATLAGASSAAENRNTAMAVARQASERIRERAEARPAAGISEVLGGVYKPSTSVQEKLKDVSLAKSLRERAEKYTEKVRKGIKEREDEQEALMAEEENKQKALRADAEKAQALRDAYKRDVLSRAKKRYEAQIDSGELVLVERTDPNTGKSFMGYAGRHGYVMPADQLEKALAPYVKAIVASDAYLGKGPGGAPSSFPALP